MYFVLEVTGEESVSFTPRKSKNPSVSDILPIKARSTVDITQFPKDSDSTILGKKKNKPKKKAHIPYK